MKVCHITSSLSSAAGGVVSAIRGLAHAQLRSGIQVSVVSAGRDDSYLELDSWKPINPMIANAIGPRQFEFAPDLTKLISLASPDIVHSHGMWMYSSLGAQLASAQCRVPRVVTPHGMLDPWALGHKRCRKMLALALFERRNLNKAACVHALCDAELHSIRALGIEGPVCVIPNGVEMPPRLSFGTPQWMTPDLEGKRILLYLGRIHKKKGIDNLLRAWAMLPRMHEWSLVVAGWDQDGHERELRALSTALDLDQSVHFIGPQFGVSKHAAFACASAFVLPSLSEGLPIAVLEAWSHGLIVLMTHACNLPEGRAAQAAIVVDWQVDQLAHGLRELLNRSNADLEAAGTRGLELVASTFAWTTVQRQLGDVYRWLSGAGERPESIRVD